MHFWYPGKVTVTKNGISRLLQDKFNQAQCLINLNFQSASPMDIFFGGWFHDKLPTLSNERTCCGLSLGVWFATKNCTQHTSTYNFKQHTQIDTKPSQ